MTKKETISAWRKVTGFQSFSINVTSLFYILERAKIELIVEVTTTCLMVPLPYFLTALKMFLLPSIRGSAILSLWLGSLGLGITAAVWRTISISFPYLSKTQSKKSRKIKSSMISSFNFESFKMFPKNFCLFSSSRSPNHLIALLQYWMHNVLRNKPISTIHYNSDFWYSIRICMRWVLRIHSHDSPYDQLYIFGKSEPI